MSSENIRVWRHPCPSGAAGRCIGAGTDLPVHWRAAKRLARRIQKLAQRERLPKIIYSSPLRRCADVGAWLKAWGWQHHQDPALLELDFGAWDGRAWAEIERAEIDLWVADFVAHAPGGGESLAALLERAGNWRPQEGGLLISHGGWMLARRWRAEQGQVLPAAATWPKPPRYGELWLTA
ncbi:histidine phosphatase family protein [Roseateles oligotrophus]|uniref:Histidine phosphatase family protein n=1 Tax=Roseateles oligotrophus TaxID=1769250 RepID=A0ABT2YBV0_9BURK|nr:histidine phosphatase family protein [Roseateles oligotrophus]MCV2366545.1 histidine phosphatase family protein [Roseateles oligotrophus]